MATISKSTAPALMASFAEPSRKRDDAAMEELAIPEGWDKASVNRWLRYHSEISYELTSQRTALESALIPITAYIVIGCVEAYRRYPELMQRIAAAMPPEEIGRAGRGLGLEIDTVRMWSIANFHLVGR